MYRIRLIVVATTLLSALSMSSCKINIGGSAIDEALAVIDNGIREISANSESWQEVLQDVATQLPEEISEAIRVEAQSLVTRSIATAGEEFRCDVDFLAGRAIQSLQRLKAELLGQNPPPLTPEFCLADPSYIDLKDSPNNWRTVILAGYNLDYVDSAGKLPQVLLQTRQGDRIPMADWRIGRTTHYQITLNLGGMAPQLYRKQIAKIVVSWDGKSEGYSEIAIVPWEPKRRKLTSVDIGTTGPYMPPKTRGDHDFHTHDDHPTLTTVKGTISVGQQWIRCRIYMRARELGGDRTTVEGWDEWNTCYRAPEGWRIVEVQPKGDSIHEVKVTGHGRLIFSRPGGEVVRYFEVWVDRDGDEAESWSRATAHWRQLNITLEEVTPSWLD